MSSVVVVGDSDFALRTRQLLPNFQVLGVTDDAELGDPVTSVTTIRRLIESARPPEAVVCSGAPGFTLLSQLAHFSASKCFVCPTSVAGWPQATLQWITEATGMTLIPSLDSLPAAMLGRGTLAATGQSDTPGLAGQAPPAPPPAAAQRDTGVSPRGDRGYEWADETPVQVPPPPVSLDREPPPTVPQIIDAGPGPSQPQTAYLPTDILRPLRPRSVS